MLNEKLTPAWKKWIADNFPTKRSMVSIHVSRATVCESCLYVTESLGRCNRCGSDTVWNLSALINCGSPSERALRELERLVKNDKVECKAKA